MQVQALSLPSHTPDTGPKHGCPCTRAGLEALALQGVHDASRPWGLVINGAALTGASPLMRLFLFLHRLV